MREKGHWEDQIKKLGGPDYRVSVNFQMVVLKIPLASKIFILNFIV